MMKVFVLACVATAVVPVSGAMAPVSGAVMPALPAAPGIIAGDHSTFEDIANKPEMLNVRENINSGKSAGRSPCCSVFCGVGKVICCPVISIMTVLRHWWTAFCLNWVVSEDCFEEKDKAMVRSVKNACAWSVYASQECHYLPRNPLLNLICPRSCMVATFTEAELPALPNPSTSWEGWLRYYAAAAASCCMMSALTTCCMVSTMGCLGVRPGKVCARGGCRRSDDPLHEDASLGEFCCHHGGNAAEHAKTVGRDVRGKLPRFAQRYVDAKYNRYIGELEEYRAMADDVKQAYDASQTAVGRMYINSMIQHKLDEANGMKNKVLEDLSFAANDLRDYFSLSDAEYKALVAKREEKRRQEERARQLHILGMIALVVAAVLLLSMLFSACFVSQSAPVVVHKVEAEQVDEEEYDAESGTGRRSSTKKMLADLDKMVNEDDGEVTEANFDDQSSAVRYPESEPQYL